MSKELAENLWEAVFENDTLKARYQLDQGADPSHSLYWSEEWAEGWNDPPLHVACENGNVEMIDLLVQAGAPVNKPSVLFKDMPIHRACEAGHKDVVVYLTGNEVRCSLDVRDDEGQTPLDKALSLDNMYRNKGCFDVALYLINCGCGGEDEKSKLLCGASQRGKLDVVIGLVEQLDVDPNSIHDEWLKSPLERALENLHKDSIMVALYLIKHGCGAEKDIAYLLCIASHRGEINMVKELIEKYKANPNSAKDGQGKSPLNLALENLYNESSVDTAFYLIKLGCGGQKEKAKLLCGACHCDKVDVVKELVEKHQVDPKNVRDNRGRTVLNITMENLRSQASLDVALYLLQQGCSSDDSIRARLLLAACQLGRLKMVKTLIKQYEVNPNDVQDEENQTPLHHACRGGHIDVIRYLIKEAHCDVDVADLWGNSPFDIKKKQESETKSIELVPSDSDICGGNLTSQVELSESNEGIKIRYPEFETMIHCRNILVATLTKLDQANNLRAMCYKEGLLTSHQHEALLAFPSGNSRLLVDALANNIRASPHFFYDFMFILVEYVDWSKDLMHTLKKKYEDLVGMEVLHWTLLEVTNMEQFFEWDYYGLKVFIPKNSLPLSIKTCTLTIGVSITGQFEFPDNQNVVSAIYAFHLSNEVKLVKPLRINLQHCAKICSPEGIFVARASCKDNSFPYNFKILSDKTVALTQDSYMGKQFVGFDLQHFSLLITTIVVI